MNHSDLMTGINKLNSTFSAYVKTYDVLAEELISNLEKVSAWLDASCLTLSTKKTKSISFIHLNVRIKGDFT